MSTQAVGGIYKEATGEELRVTDSELWGKDLVVPADAEVILEGYITERQEEAGLWCDAWQNYTKPSKQNVFRVEAMTMREQPLYVSNWPGGFGADEFKRSGGSVRITEAIFSRHTGDQLSICADGDCIGEVAGPRDGSEPGGDVVLDEAEYQACGGGGRGCGSV